MATAKKAAAKKTTANSSSDNDDSSSSTKAEASSAADMLNPMKNLKAMTDRLQELNLTGGASKLLESGQNILGNGWNAYGDVFVTTVLANGAGQIQDGFVHRLAPAG